MRPTPFLDGFRAGVRPPPEEPSALTPPLSQSWQMTISEYANHYRASIRTIERLKAAGVDLDRARELQALVKDMSDDLKEDFFAVFRLYNELLVERRDLARLKAQLEK